MTTKDSMFGAGALALAVYAAGGLLAPTSAGQYAEPRRAETAAPAQACPKWCPQDASPCDPVQFKIADGRCPPPFSFGRRF
ncbi:MAG: hypothetical protein KGI57_09705 [Hyphomicrobiales bacterium]|nr:hypothetical protein [Hyphomicrobiales bacterium]MDE2017969.1 hypothetical protein [Hyphomicrobiales bacterium]